MDFLCDVDGLEGAVGTRQLPPLLKSIDFIDEHCRALLARSPIAVLGATDASGARRATAVGGERGFAKPIAGDRLRLPVPGEVVPGSPVSTMFVIPGWREALRINGRLDPTDPSVLVVEEAFVHCGKAVIRSGLWSAPVPVDLDLGVDSTWVRRPGAPVDAEVAAFLAASPFVALASEDGDGGADCSPKGDPTGFIRVLDESTIAIPDRKGNRRTDTFHNLIDDPRLALLALVPGDGRTLELRGTASITDDEPLRRSMAEQGKVPNVVLVLMVTEADLSPSPAVAALWGHDRVEGVGDLPKAGQIWADHIKANRTGGFKAAAIRTAVNGSLVQKGTEVEYQRSLY